MSDDKNKDLILGSTLMDKQVAVAKGAFGAIPFVGTAINELITQVVPNQRLERIENYLRKLDSEMQKYGLEADKNVLNDPENVILVEDGLWQAARALSKERQEYIARCVVNGISIEDKGKFSKRKILSILSELGDEDILLLKAYCDNSWNAFSDLVPAPNTLGASKDVADANALYEGSKITLENLGLIKLHISFSNPDEPVEFERNTGRPKGDLCLTRLGFLVLDSIGLAPDNHYMKR